MQNATERLFVLIYEDLRSRAGELLDGDRLEYSIQPTALVNEAYLRLASVIVSFNGTTEGIFSAQQLKQCDESLLIMRG